VTVVINPIAKAVGPVSAAAGVADPLLRRRAAGWLRVGAIFVSHIAVEHDDSIIECIVGRRMVEDRSLCSGAGVRWI